ncbi:MAG: DUF1990 family protein [Gemmatimonadaceae bacterium]|nr:DUF1990 family protein [Gemmatimonadaceae bacterium]
MHYGTRRSRDSIPIAVPLLLASGALGLLAIVWRRTAAPRRESRVRGSTASVHDLAVPQTLDAPDMQSLPVGTGAVFHRKYEIVLTDVASSGRDVMRLMQRNLAELAPAMLAHFEKTSGTDGLMCVGDEYDITMLGPWNGMVRVSEASPTAFTLVTLDGHPEAGHITFSVTAHDSDARALHVNIESWARSRDSMVAAAYGALGIGKQVQTEVWITFLQRLATLAGMRDTPEVSITTETLSTTDDGDAPASA